MEDLVKQKYKLLRGKDFAVFDAYTHRLAFATFHALRNCWRLKRSRRTRGLSRTLKIACHAVLQEGVVLVSYFSILLSFSNFQHFRSKMAWWI